MNTKNKKLSIGSILLLIAIVVALQLLKDDTAPPINEAETASNTATVERPSSGRDVPGWTEGQGATVIDSAVDNSVDTSVDTSVDSYAGRDDSDKVARAFANQTSDLQVDVVGEVTRVLPDDNEGSRHQKFIIRLRNGNTVLISHNIDLAPRVPLDRGDTVRVYGEYEWTERGGVIHWTHHDPKGWHEDGWIEHNGKQYG
ncbi:MAG: DUF3465 domain-containing protein [Planctomycetota bacterium]